MIIYLKNKHTLMIDDFSFKCCVGKNGISKRKIEGDKKTPIGSFGIENLYYRNDRIRKPSTKLKCIKINRKMGWCDDVNISKYYNRLVINKKIKQEKLYRKDFKYDLIIPIKYNFSNPIKSKGSCIFIHLTKNYKPTAGCIALSKKDFLIMLRLIDRKTKINIY
ncbi:L,D-transpeptidase family protein [Candidatus Pelagibacter sp. HIMB1483]|uniref:L,D-transpeptidase family protein n=1 Tax=Candidatus Pelagibacter sp. HIMB1483 TaxID=3415414 RepID=UPI003F84E471